MIPLKLNVHNFLSHDKSEIDFNKFSVALILGAYDNEMDQSNGAGKSALFEAIIWALFGKSRHKKKDGIVKKDRRHCKVEFTFDVDGGEYRITRRRDKIIGEADVVLEQLDNGAYKNISCDTNTATDDKIASIINVNYEVFINSVYFKQNDISIFAEATPSKRKDILKSLLKMDVWDDYQQRARDLAKTLSTKLEEKSKLTVNTEDLSANIKALAEEISNINEKLISYNSQYAKLNEAVIAKTSSMQMMVSSLATGPEQLKKVQKEYSDYKKRVSQISAKLAENETVIRTNTSGLSDTQQKILLLNDKVKAKKDINLSEINSKLVSGRTKEKIIKEKIQHLEQDILLGEDCPICDKKLTKDDIKDINQKREKELVNLKNKHAEIQLKLNRAEDKAKNMALLLEDGNKAELDRSKLEIKLSKMKTALEHAVAENKQLNVELKKSQDKDFEKEIQDLKESFDKDEMDKLDSEIKNLTSKLSEVRIMCDKLNIDFGSKVRNKEELEKVKVEQSKIKEEIKKINDDFSVYDKLKQYFGKDGIQAVIIENVIEELEMYSNDVLTKICNEPTAISIKTQKQNDNGSWAETFDIDITIGGRADDFETLSGGEQFRVSLALRLALSKILSKRMGGTLKLLMLDEVSSSLDDKGLKMFIDAIKQIGNEMKVLVITHDEKLKEQFDDVITVNKTAEGSRASN